jgi:peptidoglycan L-alanyl-D-glutamate endopeptidase CwlK
MISSRRVDDLHPRVARMCRALLAAAKAAGIDLIVTSTYRDHEAQDALYAQGRTRPGKVVTQVRGGQSMHNYRLAFDVVPVRDGKAVWNDDALWREVGKLGQGVGLEWGGAWRRFKDRPHFQWTDGLTIKELQAGKRP